MRCPSCREDNPDRAKFCLNCGAPLEELSQPPHEVRKTVTILFSDVTGSTQIGERLDPETLRRVMERYFDRMKAELERHGGTVEKFIGDAVMAVFGIPRTHDDDALRAVRAAVDMRRARDDLNEELRRTVGVEIIARTGVHTGEVVANTTPGERQRLVTGDTVNTAARLEQAAPPGEILLGRETWRLVRHAVEVEELLPLELKGKAERESAWRLLSLDESAEGILRRNGVAFVGRSRERRLLAEAYERAVAERSCGLFTVLGIAGVGKSRLVAEVLATLEPTPLVLSGRCLPYGDGITFWPVLEIVKAASGVLEDDLPAEVRSKIEGALDSGEETEAIASRILALLGLAPQTPAIEETNWAIRRFLENVAERTPVVVVLDDLHWAEPALLELLEHVADLARDVPILLACLARPEFLDQRAGWGGGKLNATTILLEPLDAAEGDTLVHELLGGAELDPDTGARIVHAAEGNPLFVEELVAMLLDDGVFEVRDSAVVQVRPLADIELPSSILVLLAARLDRLEAPELSVVEGAAVVGQVFYRGAVAALAPEALRPDVGTYLQALVRKDLVRPERRGFPGDDTYRFRHILLRDAAYRAMPKQTRAELHERFAEWLEGVTGERLAEYEEIVGYHLEQAWKLRSELGEGGDDQARLAERAVARLVAAGERALGRGDAVAASTLLQRASAIVVSTETRVTVFLDLADALQESGRLSDALDAALEATQFAKSADARGLFWRAESVRREIKTQIAPEDVSFERFHEEAETMIGILEREDPDPLALAALWIHLGSLEWFPGHYDNALAAFDRAFRCVEGRQAGRMRRELAGRMLAALDLGSVPPTDMLLRAEQLFDHLGSGFAAERLRAMTKASCEWKLGHVEKARERLRALLSAAEDIGSWRFTMECCMQRGVLERGVGNSLGAEQQFRRAYDALIEGGDVSTASTAAGFLAEALCELSRFEEAASLGQVAENTSSPDDFMSRVLSDCVAARVAAVAGDSVVAVERIEKAVRGCDGVQCPEEVGLTYLAGAEVFRAIGDERRALSFIEVARRNFDAKGVVPLQERVSRFATATERS